MDETMGLELELLAELRAALSEHEIASELDEEFTGLKVTTATPGSYLWVFVNHSRRYFSWERADRQHPVKDVPGAARRIAEQVNRNSASNAGDGRGRRQHSGRGCRCERAAAAWPEATGDA